MNEMAPTEQTRATLSASSVNPSPVSLISLLILI
jgi:hypothetical protein